MITFIVKPAVNPVEDLYGYRDKEKYTEMRNTMKEDSKN